MQQKREKRKKKIRWHVITLLVLDTAEIQFGVCDYDEGKDCGSMTNKSAQWLHVQHNT